MNVFKLILVYFSQTIIRRSFNIITQVIIEIPKQRINRKKINFICYCHASTNNYAHKSHRGQKSNRLPRILKRSASEKNPKRQPVVNSRSCWNHSVVFTPIFTSVLTLDQWKGGNFYTHLSNYSNYIHLFSDLLIQWAIDRPIDKLIHDIRLNLQRLSRMPLQIRDNLSSLQLLFTPKYKLVLLGSVCL